MKEALILLQEEINQIIIPTVYLMSYFQQWANNPDRNSSIFLFSSFLLLFLSSILALTQNLPYVRQDILFAS